MRSNEIAIIQQTVIFHLMALAKKNCIEINDASFPYVVNYLSESADLFSKKGKTIDLNILQIQKLLGLQLAIIFNLMHELKINETTVPLSVDLVEQIVGGMTHKEVIINKEATLKAIVAGLFAPFMQSTAAPTQKTSEPLISTFDLD